MAATGGIVGASLSRRQRSRRRAVKRASCQRTSARAVAATHAGVGGCDGLRTAITPLSASAHIFFPQLNR